MSAPAAAPTAIAWIDGRWGSPAELGVPLQDRGLLLADGLFETVLIQAGQPLLLEAHLQRWQASAALLAMAPPPDAAQLEPLIGEAIERLGLGERSGRCGALRLNWSRGCAGRGIAIPALPAAPHRFWLQLSPHKPAFEPWRVIVSATERRSATNWMAAPGGVRANSAL